MSDQNEQMQELQQELADSLEYVRRAAVEQLARLGPVTFDILLKMLSDRAALVREGAALALSEFGDSRAIAPLIPLD